MDNYTSFNTYKTKEIAFGQKQFGLYLPIALYLITKVLLQAYTTMPYL